MMEQQSASVVSVGYALYTEKSRGPLQCSVRASHCAGAAAEAPSLEETSPDSASIGVASKRVMVTFWRTDRAKSVDAKLLVPEGGFGVRVAKVAWLCRTVATGKPSCGSIQIVPFSGSCFWAEAGAGGEAFASGDNVP